MPITTEEYKIAQLYSVAMASKNETGGGEGVVVVENKAYEKNGERGQYTKKYFHLQSRVPKFIKMIMPKGSLYAMEESWNAFPRCKTVITNPGYMKNDFEIKVETLHLPDLGESENVHKLSSNDWKHTEVIKIDIANDQISATDYRAELDPKLYHSEKANIGPLGRDWIKDLSASGSGRSSSASRNSAYMCAYKLVTCHFKWFGLQNKVESFIFRTERRLFTNFHRQVFCWMDMWYGLSMDDIREIEEETQKELDKLRHSGEVRGTVAAEQSVTEIIE